MWAIYLEFVSVGDFDNHLNIINIIIIFCVYRIILKTILIAWKHTNPKPGVFRLIPSMGKSRWLRILAVFGKKNLNKKPHELKSIRTMFV